MHRIQMNYYYRIILDSVVKEQRFNKKELIFPNELLYFSLKSSFYLYIEIYLLLIFINPTTNS